MAWAFHQAGIGSPFDYCYLPGISERLKCFDIQIICAIFRENLAVLIMARYLLFSY
jgi:hypothetical protein